MVFVRLRETGNIACSILQVVIDPGQEKDNGHPQEPTS